MFVIRDELLRKRVHEATRFPDPGRHAPRWRTPWALSPAKRGLDLALVGLLAAPAAALGLVIALAIRLESPGPILFRQTRTGFRGRRFRMVKFRTMRIDADAQKEALRHLSHHASDSPDFKARSDPRVTRVGRILRRLSLDELPNLLNVVRGEMSLVGPRPTSFDLAHYQEHHLRRVTALPGVTGLWQVSGRSEIDFEERVRLDVVYVRDSSLRLDLAILVRTALRVIDGWGAY